MMRKSKEIIIYGFEVITLTQPFTSDILSLKFTFFIHNNG